MIADILIADLKLIVTLTLVSCIGYYFGWKLGPVFVSLHNRWFRNR